MAEQFKFKKLNFFNQDYKKVKKLYKQAFPEYERINLAFLSLRSFNKDCELLAIYKKNIFVGFSYLVSKADLTLVLYLALSRKFQGQGCGSLILAQIKEYKKNQRLILEIEIPKKEAANYQQRLRRKDFYLKNGFEFSGLIAQEKTDEFEIMILKDKKVDSQEYLAILKKLFTPLLFKFHTPQVYLKK